MTARKLTVRGFDGTNHSVRTHKKGIPVTETLKTSIANRRHIMVLSTLVIGAALGLGGCAVTEFGELGEPGELEGPASERSDTLASQASFQGTAFVHLFEWRWPDIASECENFLGPRGFEAVQVSPPNEHITYGAWWARYQPVSYRLESRSGTRAEFIDMVQRCDAAGVAIYADMVINHTAALNGGGTGWAGTQWSVKNHPSLPAYGPGDYHSTCSITNYGDAYNVQNCELSGLPDLDTASPYVQQQIANYMNDLLTIGVAGFRIDAAKHMPPQDIQGILARAGNPYVFLEVIGSAGEAVQPWWYTDLGQVTEFGYSAHIGHRFLYGQIANLGDIAVGKLPSHQAVVFTDNHDNQRGHGGGGEPVTYKNGALYNLANVFMLAWPYGYPGLMSSYYFSDTEAGPPAGGGGCANSGFVCEHRWTAIANMVGFRNVTKGQPVANWWDNGNNRVAFGRGSKGFVVINKESGALSRTFQTGLPAGTYCNIAGGDFANGTCTGNTVTVNGSGYAAIQVNAYEAVAIHVDARMTGGGGGGVTVNFTCHNGTTYWGQSVYVVGNQAALGNWDPAQAVKLAPTSYPTWTGSVALSPNTAVEWKCLKRDEVNPSAGVEWQPGANNTLTTPASGSTSTSGSF
jgi:alpha-amylase